MKINIKELAVVKIQVNKAIITAQQLTIKTKEELEGATITLSKIKAVGKLIQQKKEGITKPLNEALKNARDLFRPLEESWTEAEKIVKQKMVAFQVAEEAKVVKKEEKIADKVDTGEMTFEQAAIKIEKIEKPETQVGNTTFKTIKKFEVINISELPIEYHLPNEVKIREEMNNGIQLKGVKYWEEKIVSSR